MAAVSKFTPVQLKYLSSSYYMASGLYTHKAIGKKKANRLSLLAKQIKKT